MASMTIKEAFQKLSKVTNAGIKNPWFVIRNLGQTFADVADNIEGGGGGGSTVEVTQVLESGTKVATITVDDTPTDIFAPTPAEPTDVEVTQVVSSGTKIATITVDDTPTDIYAPSGGGGGSWTYLDAKTGQSSITLPSDWNELLVYVDTPGSSSGPAFSVTVLKDYISRRVYSGKSYLVGASSGTQDYYVSLDIDATSVYLSYVWYQNRAATTDSKTTVYYK